MKALFLNVDPVEQEVLKRWSAPAGLEVVSTPKNINPKRLAEHADAAIVSFSTPTPVTAELFASLPQLKFVAIRQTGINHVDTAYLESRGLAWANLAHYCSQAVGEHLFALMLSLTKNLPALLPHTKQGAFTRAQSSLGTELRGKTLGLIGLGSTAEAVLPIAKGFGMKVLAWNRSPKPELIESFGLEQVELDVVLSQSDFISLHIPVTSETTNFINAERLTLLKSSASLINLARGALVDSRAMLQALDAEQLAVYACDVLPAESLLAAPHRLQGNLLAGQAPAALPDLVVDQLLLKHPKVIATPHTAFYTREAVTQQMQQTLEHLEQFLAP